MHVWRGLEKKWLQPGRILRLQIFLGALVGGSLMLSGVLPGRLLANPSTQTNSGIRETSLLSEGWRINSMEPGSSLNAEHMAKISNPAAADGWLEIPSVPAMPHKILLHHKKIEEPWKPFGMEKCYWVSQKDWIYTLNFGKTRGIAFD